eukprot:GHVN01024779.1.p1 GENE.GHVN01024779.1~~GHVN01024779.1.p1  ORF type:complete len:135 (-),score=0.04 GHVN01024779.1:638-1042(-)
MRASDLMQEYMALQQLLEAENSDITVLHLPSIPANLPVHQPDASPHVALEALGPLSADQERVFCELRSRQTIFYRWSWWNRQNLSSKDSHRLSIPILVMSWTGIAATLLPFGVTVTPSTARSIYPSMQNDYSWR